MEIQYYARLPLKKAYNVRDLGGYPGEGGQPTNWHTFLRADDLCHLENDDIQFLLDYGVKSVVDLRSMDEIIKYPDPFSAGGKVVYVNIPFIAGDIAEITKPVAENPSPFLTEFYFNMIRQSNTTIRQVFTFFGEEMNGCTLFHCAGGKDRTGVISMLLLGLGGVNKYDILSNYEVTYSNLRANPDFKDNLGKYPVEVRYSKAEYMEPVVDFINDTYGGFAPYLLSVGISEHCLNNVKKRLMQTVSA